MHRFAKPLLRALWRVGVIAILVSAMASLIPGSRMRAIEAHAETIAPADAVRRLFRDGPSDASWYGPNFLAAVPSERVDAIVAALKADFGELVDVVLVGGEGSVKLQRAIVPVSVTLSTNGQIEGLLFKAPELTGGTPQELAKRIVDTGSGKVSVLALMGGAEVVAIEADTPMAVGSAFKLAVLRAYEDAVHAGTLARDQVVTLEPGDRSLPSGVLQTVAPG
ncbi:MAG: serine hydrolase, partial [Pseudomonadota bacterium]